MIMAFSFGSAKGQASTISILKSSSSKIESDHRRTWSEMLERKNDKCVDSIIEFKGAMWKSKNDNRKAKKIYVTVTRYHVKDGNTVNCGKADETNYDKKYDWVYWDID